MPGTTRFIIGENCEPLANYTRSRTRIHEKECPCVQHWGYSARQYSY